MMEIETLRYRFNEKYPRKILSKIRWFIINKQKNILPFLNVIGGKFTVVDAFGSPGDTLLSTNIISAIKAKYKRLQINLITKNPDIIKNDPNIKFINRFETYFSITFWYLNLIENKDSRTNVLFDTLNDIGINDYVYKCNVYLENDEKKWAREKISKNNKIKIAFNCRSKQEVKNWPVENWEFLIKSLQDFEWIQLGDHTEPFIKNVVNFSGKLNRRESISIMSVCDLFIGPDSFLAHAANGVNLKSLVIFGGSRTIQNLGYSDNINIENRPPCSPCWINQDDDQKCTHKLKCLSNIKVETVKSQIITLLTPIEG